jgi:hypothetical protein
VPDTAGSGIEPFFFRNIVSYRKNLKAATFHGGQEVIDILSSKNMLNWVFLPVRGPPPFLYDPALIATDLRLVTAFANGDIFLLRKELALAN